MSAPKVDVLGVIDREIVTRDDAAIACKAAGERLDALVHAEERDELKAARVAVAELIEATIRARRMMRANGLGPGLYDFDSLDAAIKAVGGGE